MTVSIKIEIKTESKIDFYFDWIQRSFRIFVSWIGFVIELCDLVCFWVYFPLWWSVFPAPMTIVHIVVATESRALRLSYTNTYNTVFIVLFFNSLPRLSWYQNNFHAVPLKPSCHIACEPICVCVCCVWLLRMYARSIVIIFLMWNIYIHIVQTNTSMQWIFNGPTTQYNSCSHPGIVIWPIE